MTLARKNSHLAQAIDVDYSAVGDSLTIPSSGNVTITNSLAISSQTVSTIVGFDENQKLISLPTSTYPSFTELSYLKGVTSSLQTQLNAKSSSTHTHGNITNDGKIGSTADQIVVTTTDGALTAVSASTARSTLGVQPTASPAFTGTATFENTGNVVPLTVTNTGTANSFVVNDASGDTTPFVIDASGNVGIGGLDAWSKLQVAGTLPSSSGNSLVIAMNGTVPSSTTANAQIFRSVPATEAASFTLGDLRHFFCANVSVGAGSSVTSQVGFYAAPLTSAASNYGFYSAIDSGSGRWNFYASGTAANYFAGTTTFGSQILADDSTLTSTPVYSFDGDTDTGVGRGGANILTLVTGGTERVRVDASGRVGIGVTPASSGSTALQVRGDVDIFGNGSDRSITYNVGVGDDGIVGWYRSKIAFVASGAANNVSQSIVFYTKDGDNSGSTLAERFRISSDGNIGIGTTSPSYKLHLEQSGSSNSVLCSFLQPSLSNGGFNQLYIGRSTSNHDCATITYAPNSTAADSTLSLGLYGTSYSLIINGNGNVGLGTFTPTSKLEVIPGGGQGINCLNNGGAGTVNYALMGQAAGSAGANTGAYINVYNASNNYGVRIVNPPVGTNNWAIYSDAGAKSYFAGDVGIGISSPPEKLSVFADNNAGRTSILIDNLDQRLKMSCYYESGVGQYAEIQAFNNAETGYHNLILNRQGGDVLIGTATDNGAYKLQVNSQIYATNATIATSDARFKTNIKSLNNATNLIELLRPVAFDFIPQVDRNFSSDRQIGLIAQEVQSVLINTDYVDSIVAKCGDHFGLAYEKLVPLLIKALQESNARITALEERLPNN